ncbi:unnamed protein product [Urochloa humidicola]
MPSPCANSLISAPCLGFVHATPISNLLPPQLLEPGPAPLLLASRSSRRRHREDIVAGEATLAGAVEHMQPPASDVPVPVDRAHAVAHPPSSLFLPPALSRRARRIHGGADRMRCHPRHPNHLTPRLHRPCSSHRLHQ